MRSVVGCVEWKALPVHECVGFGWAYAPQYSFSPSLRMEIVAVAWSFTTILVSFFSSLVSRVNLDFGQIACKFAMWMRIVHQYWFACVMGMSTRVGMMSVTFLPGWPKNIVLTPSGRHSMSSVCSIRTVTSLIWVIDPSDVYFGGLTHVCSGEATLVFVFQLPLWPMITFRSCQYLHLLIHPLKSSQNKKDVEDLTAAPFSVFYFLLAAEKKTPKTGQLWCH